jgi:hypothetical protein
VARQGQGDPRTTLTICERCEHATVGAGLHSAQQPLLGQCQEWQFPHERQVVRQGIHCAPWFNSHDRTLRDVPADAP